MDRAAQFLAGQGWRVSAADGVFAREQRFAGPDELRASDLHAFATDRNLDVAVCARGGYGVTRLLGAIDFTAIANAGVPVVGYSDFTAFNLALLARARAISFQGPSAADFAAAGSDADAAYCAEHFFGALGSSGYVLDFVAAAVPAPPPALSVRGRLWGGNLSMVCALLGTPYFPRVTGGILFLEDVNEPAYRIERMLLQLLQAGVLGRQKAIVLGDFAPVPTMANDNGFDLAAVWSSLQERCAVPLVGGLPFGHGRRRVTLPVGAPAQLRVQEGRVQLRFRGHPTVRAAR
jgi:muramoyltetrapeptide carboxypeptidase